MEFLWGYGCKNSGDWHPKVDIGTFKFLDTMIVLWLLIPRILLNWYHDSFMVANPKGRQLVDAHVKAHIGLKIKSHWVPWGYQLIFHLVITIILHPQNHGKGGNPHNPPQSSWNILKQPNVQVVDGLWSPLQWNRQSMYELPDSKHYPSKPNLLCFSFLRKRPWEYVHVNPNILCVFLSYEIDSKHLSV